MNVEQVAAIALAALASAFNVLAFYMLRLTWSEIVTIRKTVARHGEQLAAVHVKLDLSPCPEEDAS